MFFEMIYRFLNLSTNKYYSRETNNFNGSANGFSKSYQPLTENIYSYKSNCI